MRSLEKGLHHNKWIFSNDLLLCRYYIYYSIKVIKRGGNCYGFLGFWIKKPPRGVAGGWGINVPNDYSLWGVRIFAKVPMACAIRQGIMRIAIVKPMEGGLFLKFSSIESSMQNSRKDFIESMRETRFSLFGMISS